MLGGKDGPYGAKCAVGSTGDEGFVVGVDVGIGDVAGSSAPVVGVVLPDDGAETECMSDGTDTVVDVTKGRLSERVRRRMNEQDTIRTRQQVGVTPTTSLIICIYKG